MPNLTDHYRDYYGDANHSDWRDLGARYKAANIIDLWTQVGEMGEPQVVEFGCGDGAIIQELARQGFGHSYVGYEISDSGVRQARERMYAKPTRFELFDGTKLPAEDKSFDLAILSHVLEHAEEPRQLVKEAARLANHVYVEVPLELHLGTPRDFRWTSVGHINPYSPVVIRHLLQSTGLRVLAEQVTCPGRPIYVYQRPGLRGSLHWAAKAMLLKVAPFVAWRVFTYHGSLLAITESP
jgi:SAM-dependent methyltransferase